MADFASTNLIEFQADLAAFAKKIDVDLNTVVIRTAFGLFAAIVQRTPVDTGRARASWNISLDAPDETVPPEGSYGQFQGGAETTAAQKANTTLAALKDSEVLRVVWIASALPYIEILEFGGFPVPVKKGTYLGKGKGYEIRSVNGFSRQSPNGIVAISVAEAEAEILGFLGADDVSD